MHEDELKIGEWYNKHDVVGATMPGATMPIIDPYTGYMVYGHLHPNSKRCKSMTLHGLREESCWPNVVHHRSSMRIPADGMPIANVTEHGLIYSDMKRGVLAFSTSRGTPMVMDFNWVAHCLLF